MCCVFSLSGTQEWFRLQTMDISWNGIWPFYLADVLYEKKNEDK